jgi:hypothetical protein
MRIRQSLSDLIAVRLGSPDGRAELVKLATRLIVERRYHAGKRGRSGNDQNLLGEATGSWISDAFAAQ